MGTIEGLTRDQLRTVKEDLVGARQILVEEGWARGGLYMPGDDSFKGGYCVAGSIIATITGLRGENVNGDLYVGVYHRFNRVTCHVRELIPGMSLSTWNDVICRDAEEATSLLDRAIADVDRRLSVLTPVTNAEEVMA